MVLSPIIKASASTVVTNSALNARLTQFAVSSRRSEPKMQLEQAARCLPWCLARWPSSPMGLKKYGIASSPSSPAIHLKTENEVDNQTEFHQFDLTSPSNNEDVSRWKRREVGPGFEATTEKKSIGMIDLEDQTSISLAKIRVSVRSPPSSQLIVPDVGSELALTKTTLYEEFDEFRRNPEEKVKMFPEYLSDKEKLLVKHVAESLRLGCQIGEHTISVFKTGPYEGSVAQHALFGRSNNRGLASDSAFGDDVYVDVPSLAQHGKDGFISRLQLKRLSSGGGHCRNMLWDVAELSSADGIADRVSEGEGGVYAVQSKTSGEKLAMFKPVEEENFVREGIIPGEGAVREEAAYVLDSRSNGFSGVPVTAVARLHLSNIGKTKHGAVQRFMGSTGSMESYGMPYDLKEAEKFVPVAQVHRVALLDIRTFNTDRHPGNILLIGDKAPYTMVPIDHGCILPSWFHLSEARFDWIEYPQCKVPLSEHSLSYIESLDDNSDAIVLRQLGIREECVATMKICALFLKLAARAGRTIHWMGKFMQREGCFENPSKLELAIQQACNTTGMPFEFATNEYGEQKAQITPSLLTRRPSNLFYKNLERVLKQAVAMTGS